MKGYSQLIVVVEYYCCLEFVVIIRNVVISSVIIYIYVKLIGCLGIIINGQILVENDVIYIGYLFILDNFFQ